MTSTTINLLFGALAFTSAVNAHGTFMNFTADRNYPWPMSPPPNKNSVGWYSDNNDNANIWVDQSYYKSPDFVCGRSASPGALHAKVAAGESVTVQWYQWAPNHRGPILSYLANCHGPCDQVDKTKLQFVKIEEMGLLRPLESPNPGVEGIGYWATDVLFKTSTHVIQEDISGPDKVAGRGPTWSIKIPAGFAAGNYTLRHEIIALFAGKDNTQHYPRCINIEVTGGGSENPEGIVASELYNTNMSGVTVRTWEKPKNYTIPGPPLYKGGNTAPVNQTSASAVAPSASKQANSLSNSQTSAVPSRSASEIMSSARGSASSTESPAEASPSSAVRNATASSSRGGYGRSGIVTSTVTATDMVIVTTTVTVTATLS